jgi:hypothetical protein
LLEKDIWVVRAIDGLFLSEFGKHLVFKGGTSLSKAYNVIRRFSEDVDVTYDVRQLIPELARYGTLPKNNSQVKKWRDAIDEKLPAWILGTVVPIIAKHAHATGVEVDITCENDKIYIDYGGRCPNFGRFPQGPESDRLRRGPERDSRVPLGGGPIRSPAGTYG